MKIKTFIISYNRLTFLKKQIEFLSKNPLLELMIIDNHSTYPPLLKYYDEIADKIHITMCEQNYGHTVVWDKGFSKLAKDLPYIVTDSDILPNKETFLNELFEGLKQFPEVNKVGLGLQTNDIPFTVPFRNQIIYHEEQALKRIQTKNIRFEYCAVDTTLALYRGGYHYSSVWGYENNSNQYDQNQEIKSLRTTYPWIAKHLSWYLTKKEIQKEENQFYLSTLKKDCGHWSQLQKKL